MTRMRYVKMDRIMNHMLIHALREVFRQEKEQGLPVDTTRDLVLKLAEQEEYLNLTIFVMDDTIRIGKEEPHFIKMQK